MIHCSLYLLQEPVKQSNTYREHEISNNEHSTENDHSCIPTVNEVILSQFDVKIYQELSPH